MASYEKFLQVALALDPVHVGTGGARIGRVDLTIVRDPVTQVPKIPGSSLAGVYRTYVAMAEHEKNPNRIVNNQSKPFFPNCAGLGLDTNSGHCRLPDCPVCTVFGFARGAGQEGGFAGLAAFTDAHVLLFPVPTRKGPRWVTCPMALRLIAQELSGVEENAAYVPQNPENQPNEFNNQLNLGWLLLPVKPSDGMAETVNRLKDLKIPDYIDNNLVLVPDRLFAHIVNSNLEVRTSVSINPQTGAAEERALFSYEALPRQTVLVWEILAKNPKHFQVQGKKIAVNNGAMDSPDKVHEVVKQAHPYLEHLGIGGMGTRGMGRIEVLYEEHVAAKGKTGSPSSVKNQPAPSANQGGQS